MWFLLLFCLVGTVVSVDQHLAEKFDTLPRDEFIEYFNRQNYSWKMTHYENLEGKHLACVKQSTQKYPYIHHDLDLSDQLPNNFDAREAWSDCNSIKRVYDQAICGSCWTFGSAGTASDRTCIHKNQQVILSEQDFQCCKDCAPNAVCGGGFPQKAFEFWIKEGLVTEECKPYDIPNIDGCKTTCVKNNINYDQDKHHGSTIYSVQADLDQIKAELFKNGPIQAGFAVYEDFVKYKKGIYEHKFGEELGMHSVRVIGYGKEDGVDYWLVSNSWGESWGEQGHFRIKAFQDDIQFENDLLTGLP